MQPRMSFDVVTGQGIRGDAAFGSSRRQVLLIELETLAAFALDPGMARENIVTKELSLDGLNPGDRLRIDDVILEITGPCAPCEYIDTIRPGLRREIAGRRGLLARVAHGGTISVGSSVQIELNGHPGGGADA